MKGMDKKKDMGMNETGKGGGGKTAGINFCKECQVMTEGEYCSMGCKMRAGGKGKDMGGM